MKGKDISQEKTIKFQSTLSLQEIDVNASDFDQHIFRQLSFSKSRELVNMIKQSDRLIDKFRLL